MQHGYDLILQIMNTVSACMSTDPQHLAQVTALQCMPVWQEESPQLSTGVNERLLSQDSSETLTCFRTAVRMGSDLARCW